MSFKPIAPDGQRYVSDPNPLPTQGPNYSSSKFDRCNRCGLYYSEFNLKCTNTKLHDRIANEWLERVHGRPPDESHTHVYKEVEGQSVPECECGAVRDYEADLPARCPDCYGSGVLGHVTREMALDAGDVRMEGMPFLCPTCNGSGIKANTNAA